MKISYTVHSAARQPVEIEAKSAAGRDVMATVPGLTVELVFDGHGHIFRLVPDSDAEMAEMVELFAPGSTVTATFAKGDAA